LQPLRAAPALLGLCGLLCIAGYPGAPSLFLAMQSGEADGQVVALSSLTGTQQALWNQKLVRPLVQFGRVERLASLPDVPTGRELIKDADGLALLEFAELPFFMALPLVAPAGYPTTAPPRCAGPSLRWWSIRPSSTTSARPMSNSARSTARPSPPWWRSRPQPPGT
jgi:hypothetical protein